MRTHGEKIKLLQRAAEKALTAPLRGGEGEAHVALGGARLATRDDDVERPAHVALDQRRDRLAHTHKVGAPHGPDGDQGVPGPEGVRVRVRVWVRVWVRVRVRVRVRVGVGVRVGVRVRVYP